MRLLFTIGSRLWHVLLSLFITLSLIFFVIRGVPGGPAEVQGGIGSTQKTIGRAQERYGLDQPIIVQYQKYLGRMLVVDFGHSYVNNRSVKLLIAERLPLTLSLTLVSFALSLLVALPLSLLATLRKSILLNGIITTLGRIALSIPEFWLGLILILFFVVWIPVLPLFGSAGIFHFILPIATLAFSRAAALMYVLREALIQEQQKKYIIAARLRGIPNWRLGTHWLLRNSLPSILPIMTLQLGYLFGGAVIIEQLFALPGFGRLMIGALQARDYPVIEGGTACIALLFAVISQLADSLHQYIDPRLRSKEQIETLI